MKPSDAANLELLKSLARRAMLEGGLLPEFSAAALSQSDVVAAPKGTCGFIDFERLH